MAQRRDWIDYANLASNIAQNIQLRDVQHKLGDVASAIREQTGLAERESKLRDAVFQADTLLRNLRKISKANPRAAMAWARQALMQFNRNSVSSASFRSYDDKERLRSVLEGYEQTVQECSSSLSTEQKEEADRCGLYLMERHELNLLAKLAPKKEELDRLHAELNKLKPSTAASVVGFVSLFLCGLGLVERWIAANLDLDKQDLAGPVGFYALVLSGILFIVAVCLGIPHGNAKAKLQEQIKSIIQSEPLSDPSLGFFQPLSERFGGLGSQEISRMQADRERLISEVLSQAEVQCQESQASHYDDSEDPATKEG